MTTVVLPAYPGLAVTWIQAFWASRHSATPSVGSTSGARPIHFVYQTYTTPRDTTLLAIRQDRIVKATSSKNTGTATPGRLRCSTETLRQLCFPMSLRI
jgi:hypothetical protein